MLKRINDALPELILGILIYEIVVEFTGIWFVKDKLGYSNGLLIGAATAIGSYRTKCVDENRFQALKIKG